MITRKRIHLLYFFVDLVLICISFYLSCRINPALIPQNPPALKLFSLIFAFWGISLILLLHSSRLYITERRLSITQEWVSVIRCVLLSAFLTALIIFYLKADDIFSRAIFAEVTVALAAALCVWRTVKRLYVRYLIQRGHLNYNVLIVGAGRSGQLLRDEINTAPYLGLNIAGFVDDKKISDSNFPVKILGAISDLKDVIKKYFIDQLYITIPSERKVVSQIIQTAINAGIAVMVVPDHFDLSYRLVGLNYIGHIPVMTYFEKDQRQAEVFLKRVLDFIISSILLLVLAPVFLIIAFLIKIESPGPVFYVSARSGMKGRIFNFYKFRSMVDGADNYKESLRDKSEVKGPIFKIRNDPRMTAVGKFLRRYSLDELPQLINVMKGEMSLVGPRPFPVDESRKLECRHLPRLNIKPGITGMAQIKGRSDLSFQKWAKWDLWYLDRWSLGLDFKILLWTIPTVLKGKGAY